MSAKNVNKVQKDYPEEIKWLIKHTDPEPKIDSKGKPALSYFASLLKQVQTKGFLSEKQVFIIQKTMALEEVKTNNSGP